MDRLAHVEFPLAGTPFGDMLHLCLLLVALTWLLSVVTREYSWVDRVWSTAPPIYVTYVAWSVDFSSPRLNVMAALVWLWGIRLTFNFARKGGFSSGGEDYRWEVLREKLGPKGFQLLNATFISPYQNLLIWGFCAPAHTAWCYPDTAWGPLDTVATVAFVVFWLGETVADEQMWAFQQDKKARIARGDDVVHGFYRDGLYRYSRHPNYFCEMSQWWVFYLFAVSASASLWNGTLAGAVLLTVLFDGSVRFSESISRDKYPSYAEYQASTSRLIPWFVRR